MSVQSDAFCAKLAAVGFSNADAMDIWNAKKAEIDKLQIRKGDITTNINTWQNEKSAVDAKIQAIKTFLGI